MFNFHAPFQALVLPVLYNITKATAGIYIAISQFKNRIVQIKNREKFEGGLIKKGREKKKKGKSDKTHLYEA